MAPSLWRCVCRCPLRRRAAARCDSGHGILGLVTLIAESHDELRPLMFSIAYRMLGSVAEAEDVVQDALLRMTRAAAEGEEPT